MRRKYTLIMLLLGITAVLMFTGYAAWQSTGSLPSFADNGYILRAVDEQSQVLPFRQGDTYAANLAGAVTFESEGVGKVSVPRESFAHLDNASTLALSDGILLDFDDLSENFINNYYIPAGMPIVRGSGSYTAETTAGLVEFGEHMWKLSDTAYIVRASAIRAHFGGSDIREAGEFVQISITQDRVAYIQTADNLWMTISPDCYLQTAKGVKVYPLDLLVDDGSYKLSMAKLAVSMDDAVVLAEAEQRRQIVPKLNIEAEDGEDGDDGTQGAAGAAGQGGAAGTAGEGGKDGDGGKRGPNGPSGKDAIETSTNSALPGMTFAQWILTPTQLKAQLSIQDTAGFLQAISYENDHATQYPGRIQITEVKTGKPVLCYNATVDPQDGTFSIVSVEAGQIPVFDFTTGAATVAFATEPNALKPDTEYRLSVSGYYKTDKPSMIYSRTFIDRVFTTDSTGVLLNHEYSTTDSVSLSATLMEDASIGSAEIFLLTQAQNEKFTAASINDAQQYTARKAIQVSDPGALQNFSGLTPNTTYIARVYVATTSGLNTLTEQELAVQTLKRQPDWDKTAKPRAAYNRVSGAFEVWHPVIDDPDGGVVNYVYTPYDASGKPGMARKISANAGGPAEFQLEPGEYTFGVTMEFFDNEKTIHYDLGISDVVIGVGSSLPKLDWTQKTSQVNSMEGTLRINLNSNASLAIDANRKLKLEFYANQVMDAQVELSVPQDSIPSGNPNAAVGIGMNGIHGTATLLNTQSQKNPNYVDIRLDMQNLAFNTNYSVTVSGYLDVGDSNGHQYRELGTLSFRTTSPQRFTGDFQPPQGNDYAASALAMSLKLEARGVDMNNSAEVEALCNSISEIQDGGQVMMALYEGTGTGKRLLANSQISGEENLRAIFGTVTAAADGSGVTLAAPTGLVISDDNFKGVSLQKNYNYTLSVAAVNDRTHELTQLSYTNEFPVANGSIPVTPAPVPPDLLEDPSKGVKVTPILNRDSLTNYGKAVNPKLPGDAVVGYELAAQYDNVQRLGLKVNYYIYDFRTMVTMLSQGADPLGAQSEPLKKITLDISNSSDTVPKVAVFFGGNPSKEGYYGNTYICEAGEAQVENSVLKSGMDRGFRYIFAYTVEYGDAAAPLLYPARHPDYTEYRTRYGGLTINGVPCFAQSTYMLHSGLVEAPKYMPDFHTYVDHTAPGTVNSGATVSTTTAVLHYTWRDPEGLIKTNGNNTTDTKIRYSWQKGYAEAKINATPAGTSSDGMNWYSVPLHGEVVKSGKDILTATVNISPYELDYSAALQGFNLPADSSSYLVAQVPVEWPYAEQYQDDAKIYVKMETVNRDNYFRFELMDSNLNRTSPDVRSFAKRVAALELTFDGKDRQGQDKSDLVLRMPLMEDSMGYYCKVVSGVLEDFTDFEVKDVKAYYDTGLQGWSYAQDQYVALQYTNTTVGGEAGLSDYYAGQSNSEKIPLASLLYKGQGFTTEGLRDTVKPFKTYQDKPLEVQDSKIHAVFYKQITGDTGHAGPMLYPVAQGVDASSGSSMENLSNRYLVPKKLTGISLNTFGNAPITGTNGSMTPTMADPNINSQKELIAINPFRISGMTDGTIYAAAFSSRDGALSLSQAEMQGQVVTLQVQNGTTQKGTLTGLAPGKTYYLAFYYYPNAGTTGTQGSPVLLLKMTDGEKAIYPQSTATDVMITQPETGAVVYQNDSYFDKRISLYFNLNRFYNLTMRYDLFDSQEEANKPDGAPLLSHEQLTRGIMSCPEDVSLKDVGNVVSLNLDPSVDRSMLDPGGTYYLRIQAKDSTTDAGQAVLPFTIPPVGAYGALINIVDAGNTTERGAFIDFQVSVTDPQYSYMGDGANKNAGGFYAVRFVDKDGTRLLTAYDDQIFYAGTNVRETFHLEKKNLTSQAVGTNVVLPNEEYTIQVFAIPDTDHDGTIQLEGTAYSWDTFKTDPTGTVVQGFQDYINSKFWDGTKAKAEIDPSVRALLVEQKTQKTTDASGSILEEKSAYATRSKDDHPRVVLDGSFKLISNVNGQQQFVYPKVEWQIEGQTIGDVFIPFKDYGTLLNDKAVQMGKINNTDTYYVDLPCEPNQGIYTIVLKFYRQTGAAVADKTVTVRLAD